MRLPGLVAAIALASLAAQAPVPEAPAAPAAAPAPAAEPALRFVRTIALPGVEGRIDHLAWAAAERRVFVAALGNGSVEVVDLERGERVGSVSGLKAPQGIAYVPERGAIAVACGGDGRLVVLAARDLAITHTVAVGEDADNVRLAADGGATLFVAHGDGALAAVATDGWRVAGRTEFRGHPEGFQLLGADRAIVNVPAGGADGGPVVLDVDLAHGRVRATWPLADAAQNFPMAVAAQRGLAFVGCRRAARVLALDLATGAARGAAACVGDVDDLFVDRDGSRLFAIGGEGAVDVFDVGAADPVRTARVATRAGARTGLLVPELGRLFVAVPRIGAAAAELREYAVAD